MRRRKGGTVASIVFFFVFMLVFLTVLAHIFPLYMGGSSTQEGSPSRGSCTAEQATGGAAPNSPGFAPVPNAPVLSSYVISLPVTAPSSTDGELLNSSWWHEAIASSDQSFEDMPQGLYWGFLNDSQSMQEWLQTMPNPPPWASTGVMSALQAQLDVIQSNATASGNSTQAKNSVRDFIAELSGAGLAGLDFITAGSLSALKTYDETHDPYLALCATFPGQLAQLFANSFDPSVSIDQRARYFGELLAVGSLTAVVAGHDQFDENFKAALSDSNLLDAWPDIKSQLSDIASQVSSNAAGLALEAVSKVAENFPSVQWAGDYTGFRIDSMVDVLHNAGEPNGFVEGQLSGLVQAANGAGDPTAVGDAADGISYDNGHGIRLYITTQGRGYLYSDANTMQQMKASFLQERVPGFQVGQPAFLKVTYQEAGATVYHYYTGGEFWNPTVPDGVAKPGNVVTISVQVLTRDAFAASLPPMDFVNDQAVSYIGDRTRMTDSSVSGDQLTVRFSEDPPVEANMQFAITGTMSSSLGWNSGSGPYLDVSFSDIFSDTRTLRIYYDGYDPAGLGLSIGTNEFRNVYFVSNDGVRLNIVYSSGPHFYTATFYPVYAPWVLYTLQDMVPFDLSLPDVTGYSQSYVIDNVGTTRTLEHEMIYKGSMTDVGTVGAEIAYTVAREKLGLTDVTMSDIAEGGSDLYTPDHNVVIEARMLSRTVGGSGPALDADLTEQLNEMIGRINSDFSYYKASNPVAGYAILSYVVDQNTIKTIVLEVLPP